MRAPTVAARADALALADVSVLALSGALAPMRDSCLWADDYDVSGGNQMPGLRMLAVRAVALDEASHRCSRVWFLVCFVYLLFHYSADEHHPRA